MTAILPRVTTRRPVAGDDRLLRELFASTCSEIFLLDPDVRDMLLDMQYRDQQRRRLIEHPHVERLILTMDGQDVGVIELERRDMVVHVVDLVVRRRFRRRGVAAGALQNLIAEGHVTAELSVTNRPARELAERVGFHVVAELAGRLSLAS